MQIGTFVIDISFGDVVALIVITSLFGGIWEFIERKVRKYRKERRKALQSVIDVIADEHRAIVANQFLNDVQLFIIPQEVKESELEAEINKVAFEGVPAVRLQGIKDLIGKYVRIVKDGKDQ